MSLIELTYLGYTKSRPLEEAKILDFARSARVWNSDHGLTGAIMYGNDFFIQILEGGFYDVERVCRKINRYSPCENVIRLDCRPLKLRSFSFSPSLCISQSQLINKLPSLADALKISKPYQKERLLYVAQQFSKYYFNMGESCRVITP
jgi:hypothetical protein